MWESKIRQKESLVNNKQNLWNYFQTAEINGDWKPLGSDGSLVVYMMHIGGFSLVTLGQMFKPLKPLTKLALVIENVSSLSWESSTMEKNHPRKATLKVHWEVQKGEK